MNAGRVRDVMTRAVRTAREDDDLENALQRMLWCGIRHLVVVRDDGAVAGVLSQRDVLERMALATDALALGHPSARQTVRAAMRVPAETIAAGETVGAAARRMAARRLGCLPVLEEGRLVGIVTTTDLLAELGMSEALKEVTASPRVGDVMTRDPVCVRAEDPLSTAIRDMLEKTVRHLPVVDASSKVVGILSDRDVRAAIGHPRFHAADPRAADRRVGQVMTSAPFTLSADEPIDRAIGRFLDHRIGAIPVVDPAGTLVGIVSYLDVLRYLRGTGLWSGTTGP